jgi:DNA-binding NtrC family response regulator
MSAFAPETIKEQSFLMQPLSLLIVDAERVVRDMCKQVAESIGFKVQTAESVTTATNQLELHTLDVVLLDIGLPGSEGLGLLLKIKQRYPCVVVTMIPGHSGADSVLAALKGGAHDYLCKPFKVDDFRRLLERVADHLRLPLESRSASEPLRSNRGYGGMVGCSPEMEKLYRIIAKVAFSRHPVMIQGESGTGKEMVARAIHFTGPHRDKPFIPVYCGVLPATLLESELFGYVKGAFSGAVRSKEGLLLRAGGGTVFLDEIGEMSPQLQARLLRALQEREIRPTGSIKTSTIDVRVIAATSCDLEVAIHQGRFRRDLYSRLNVVGLRLPPLRERKEDVGLLADYFLERISRTKGVRQSLNPDVMERLLAYPWPGNVRELENCLEHASTLGSGPALTLNDLPAQIQNANGQIVPLSPARPGAGIVPLAELEKQAILATLHQLQGDKMLTAKLLGIGKTTLYRKLKEYGIVDRWSMAAAHHEARKGAEAG